VQPGVDGKLIPGQVSDKHTKFLFRVKKEAFADTNAIWILHFHRQTIPIVNHFDCERKSVYIGKNIDELLRLILPFQDQEQQDASQKPKEDDVESAFKRLGWNNKGF
jgi:hypothetical protein